MSKDNFIRGNMSADEQDHYLQKLFDQRANALRKQRWAKLLAEQEQIIREPSPTKPSNNWRSFLFIAAGLAMLMAFCLWWLQPQNEPMQLADQYLNSADIHDPRGIKGEIETETLRLQAVEAFNDGNYTEAITAYEALERNTNTLTIEDQFHFALAFLLDKRSAEAIPRLQSLQGEPRYQQEVQWYLGLAHLQNNDPEAAQGVLEQIQAAEWQYQAAQEILSKLSR